MGQLAEAVKAAASVVWGNAPVSAGDRSGTLASELNVFDPVIARNLVDGMTASDLYATQPHLRTVVSFVSRNGAQLGRHIYAKDSKDERTRVTDGPAAKLASHPNEYMTGYDLFNMLFSELALHDMAIWVPRMKADGDWAIDPIPMEWVVGVKPSGAFQQAAYHVLYPGAHQYVTVPASDAVVFRGYNARSFAKGSSAVVSLKSTLAEQVSAMSFRRQMWERGGRVGMFMSRPATAPTWSKEAKEKFIQNWRNSWSGTGGNAGSTPLLEDGMELKRVGFNAKEEQWLEAATLSLVTVAGAYHVPPAMVGVSGYNSFASVKEFRKMLYTETLGPLIAQVEETWNTFLMPLIDAPAGQYLELNIHEKLQGDFEEQAAQLFQAVGGPYMTAAEARKKMNLPYLPGTDELLSPLNMGAAGNNGPNADEEIDPEASEDEPTGDKPPKLSSAILARMATDHLASEAKSPGYRASSTHLDALNDDLAAYFKRQGKEIAGKLSEKGPEWWDEKKWNRELSALLQPHLTSISAGVARKAAGAKGLDPADYSVGRTAAFLKSVAASRADLINSTTRDQVKHAIEADGDDLEARVANVFEVAKEARAAEATKTMGTMLAGWGVTEMARQLLSDKSPMKTWVSSGLPDSRHSELDGETVGINEKFSNGADWPGDPGLGAAEVANCGCGVDITY